MPGPLFFKEGFELGPEADEWLRQVNEIVQREMDKHAAFGGTLADVAASAMPKIQKLAEANRHLLGLSA